MKKLIIRVSIITYLLFVLAAVCTAGFFWLKSVVWYNVKYRKQSCFTMLGDLSRYIEWHLIDKSKYPDNFNLLSNFNLLLEENCFSCSSTNGSMTQKYNIFGGKIGDAYLDKPPKIDYCYLYHESLPKKSSTILAYCPNQHGNNEIITVFCDYIVKYVPIGDFCKQFNLQTKLLEKAQVKFSFNKGIISNNEVGEKGEFKKNN